MEDLEKFFEKVSDRIKALHEDTLTIQYDRGEKKKGNNQDTRRKSLLPVVQFRKSEKEAIDRSSMDNDVAYILDTLGNVFRD